MKAVLFKFCGGESAETILKGNSLFVTSPLDLNDPFEMRPAWTDHHEKSFLADQQVRSQLTGGGPVYVPFARDMPKPAGMIADLQPRQPASVELHRGISDRHNSPVFRFLHSRFRVLSLVSNLFDLSAGEGESDEYSTLMWSHYADQFQGVCLALDPDQFDNGIRTGGFPVQYPSNRQSLPPSYYDCWQSLARQPGSAGHNYDPASLLCLTPAQQADSQERHFLEFLTHKSPAWNYEHEVRMIYDRSKLASSPRYRRIECPCEACRRKKRPSSDCRHASYRDAIELVPAAVRAIIFGADCPLQVVQGIRKLLTAPRYQNVETYWSCLHSSRYRVQYVRGSMAHIEGIQWQLAKQVAFAKNHYRNKQPRLARKGTNYVGD